MHHKIQHLHKRPNPYSADPFHYPGARPIWTAFGLVDNNSTTIKELCLALQVLCIPSNEWKGRVGHIRIFV
jgi:hypothetical protein